MILIINNKDKLLDIEADPRLIVFEDLCKIKKFNQEPYVILLLDVEIDKAGILSGYVYLFEELFITLDIVAVISTKHSKKLQELCQYYKIPLINTD
ncbi:MAG: hypothetical protein M0R05_07265 [Bacilli bacterium]|nr:hypothetical protein [Bacilli bacterium]